jgi:hypothetical protein
MQANRNHASYPNFSPLAPALQELDVMILQLPEPEQWRLLQEIIDRGLVLRDETLSKLDAHMQGALFLQDWVENRRARIEFARSPAHMAYLRDAAGSRNVWMEDDQFGSLVAQDDSMTLACFARSETMQPQQLMYIVQKLAAEPHGNEVLAGADDARITLKKAVEVHGNSPELALMRLASAALQGTADLHAALEAAMPCRGLPRDLWSAYINLKKLDRRVISELLDAAWVSSGRPVSASGYGGRFLH